MTFEEICSRFSDVVDNAGQCTALCPAHDDNVRSLSIGQSEDGDVLIHCHAGCEPKDVLAEVGLQMKDLFQKKKKQPSASARTVVEEYLYHDLNGVVVHKTIRYEGKQFGQARPDPNRPGNWIPNLKGVETIPYNLPGVANAISLGQPVFVVEGEKDVEAMRVLGLTATTCPAGAGKWKDRHSGYLANALAYIVPDNDKSGKSHAYKVAESLKGKARQVKVLDLTRLIPLLQAKGDISDVVQALGTQVTIQKLFELMTHTDVYDGGVPVEPSQFFNKDRFMHDALALHMMNTLSIAKIRKRLSVYLDGLFTAERSAFDRLMLTIVPTLTIAQRNEVYAYISNVCMKVLQESPANFIGLKDYVLDIDSWSMYPYSPAVVISNRIQCNYSATAYHKELDEALNAYACGDPGVRALIEEMFGYCLYRRNELGVSFFLNGKGKNGKSTLLTLLARLLGEDNYSGLDLKDLNKQFINIEIVDKLANIGDDISDEYIADVSTFRKLVTGEPVTVRGLYEKPLKFRNYSKLIFSCNDMPVVRDKTDGFKRRLLLVPLNARFDITTPGFDPYFIDRISAPEALEYLLRIAIEGLKRVLANRGFTRCAVAVKATQAYVEQNNPLVNFVAEMNDLSTMEASGVYLAYRNWAILNGFKPYNNIVFGRELHKQTGYVSIPNGRNAEGKRVRRYVKEKGLVTTGTDVTDGEVNLYTEEAP